MGDEAEQQHKTMIKQLTDLDEQALDEQAGLFMHPRRKSLRTETTPRPVSQPFFQPLQVFPDVLSVSAMVERQEQKDQQKDSKEQREGQEAAAPAAVTNVVSSGALSSGTATPASALAQYPQGLAVQQGGDAEGKAKQTLRSASLTRMVAEQVDGALAAAEGARGRRQAGPVVTSAQLDDVGPAHGLRAGTPLETPTEEGERQLSVETSRAAKGGRRAGRRMGGGPAAATAVGGSDARLFIRRGNNASSRGSEEENSDGDEQFIYRNSRSSLHVSSIPEEDCETTDRGRRRATRHRLSTFMGRRDSGDAGGRRAGRAGRAGGSVATSGGVQQPSINHGGHHRFSILAHNYGLSSEESDADAEPAGLRSTYNGNLYSRRGSRRAAHAYYGSSEDLPETTPLFRRQQQRRKRQGAVAQAMRAVGLSLGLLAALVGLVALFNLTSAPLGDVEALRISNILATEKELLFIVHVQATNPNIREVLVERAEIGVFAAAAVNGSETASEAPQAILLGNVYSLSDPMRFTPGSLRTSATGVQTTQISIHSPGGSLDDDGDGSARWRRLLTGPYDLTVRGTLQYSLWQRNYAARVCVVKLANLPPDTNSTAFQSTLGLSCDDDDDTITLPIPPAPPLG